MTSRDFCYWLQGFFELRANPTHEISGPQADMIARHLALVFKHEIDPSIAKPGTPDAKVLDEIHEGLKKPVWPHRPDDGGSGLIRC